MLATDIAELVLHVVFLEALDMMASPVTEQTDVSLRSPLRAFGDQPVSPACIQRASSRARNRLNVRCEFPHIPLAGLVSRWS